MPYLPYKGTQQFREDGQRALYKIYTHDIIIQCVASGWLYDIICFHFCFKIENKNKNI